MSYLDLYNRRLNSAGNSSSESIINSTKQSINGSFSSSLGYQTVLIDGVEKESIISQGKTSDDKKILLLPDEKLNIGSLVYIGDFHYLTLDSFNEGINEVYPTGVLKKCNSTLPIQSGKTRVLIGNNPRTGEPIYDWVEGEETLVPCVTETKYSIRENNDKIPIPDGTMLITMQYKESLPIQHNFEFSMYDERYKVLNIDKTKVLNGKGIIVITAERVQISEP
ncbi:hypothetical protein [Bacillus sp. UMB0728]|uniref:hypothetical protein n=1 Tax=Bacillus sp. UMB0728 TaxID=2066052 RepID=UPI000C76E393|nr:hypothetical protein [Bacillus sp. UMB0728]PLR72313.1 hypothetical protein CYJ37_12215 [Bacillus sp. UMB0728]